jgi:hypothetical protein
MFMGLNMPRGTYELPSAEVNERCVTGPSRMWSQLGWSGAADVAHRATERADTPRRER